MPVTQQQVSFEQNKVAGPKATSLIDLVHAWFKDEELLCFKWIYKLWSPYVIKKLEAKSAVSCWWLSDCMFLCLSLSIPVYIIKLQRIHVVATYCDDANETILCLFVSQSTLATINRSIDLMMTWYDKNVFQKWSPCVLWSLNQRLP